MEKDPEHPKPLALLGKLLRNKPSPPSSKVTPLSALLSQARAPPNCLQAPEQAQCDLQSESKS